MRRFTVHLDDDLIDQVHVAAKADERTLTVWVSRALRAYLAQLVETDSEIAAALQPPTQRELELRAQQRLKPL